MNVVDNDAPQDHFAKYKDRIVNLLQVNMPKILQGPRQNHVTEPAARPIGLADVVSLLGEAS